MPTRDVKAAEADVAEGHFPIVAPLTPSAGQIVAHRGWSTAREALLTAVQTGPGLVALLGPAGTGKTLLLQDVTLALRSIRPDVLLVDRGDAIMDWAGLEGVVLIDEADRLDADALTGLASRRNLAVVLAALPAFADRVARLPDMTIVPLGPIDEDEVPRFVAERLVQLGHAPDLLTLSAITALFERSGSIPRLLHTLLGLAVFAASLEGAERVTPEDVARAVQFRDGGELEDEPSTDVSPEPALESAVLVATTPLVAAESPPGSRRWLGGALALLLLCIGTAAALFQQATTVPSGTPVVQTPIAADPGISRDPVILADPASPAPASGPETPPLSTVAPVLPSSSMIRVVLSYPMGDSGAARRGGDLARELRADGVTVGEPVPVVPRIGAPSLLYYFTQDRDGAAAIGRKLDGHFGEATLARLPPRSALPRPGTIELMLSPSEP